VPQDTDCEVSASGLNLNVSCELSHTLEKHGWDSWSGRINDGGGAKVKFDTVNGSLMISGKDVPAASEQRATEETRSGPAVTKRLVGETISHTEVEEEIVIEPTVATAGAEAHPETIVVEHIDEEQTVPPPMSRMDILKAVESGEMRVEDALKRLRSLN
jgi:hypothetical protein